MDAAPKKKYKRRRKRANSSLPWNPTDEQLGEVKGYAILGMPQEEIARHMGVDIKTLTKYAREQLDNAKPKFLAAVANSLGRQALGAPAQYDKKTGQLLREELKPESRAAIFILKTQGKKYGWVERLDIGPPEELDLKDLTDDELRIVSRAQAILARFSPPPKK